MDTAAIIEMHPLSYLFPEDHDCPPWRLWLYVATLSFPHLDEEIFFDRLALLNLFKPLHFISRVVIYVHLPLQHCRHETASKVGKVYKCGGCLSYCRALSQITEHKAGQRTRFLRSPLHTASNFPSLHRKMRFMSTVCGDNNVRCTHTFFSEIWDISFWFQQDLIESL